MLERPILAIDFDGVIVEDQFPDIGSPMPGVGEYIEKLSRYCTIIIWTCRDGFYLLEAENWLKKHQIPYDYINANSQGNITKYGNNPRKVFADIYVDDRQVGGFLGWDRTYELILTQLRRKNI